GLRPAGPRLKGCGENRGEKAGLAETDFGKDGGDNHGREEIPPEKARAEGQRSQDNTDGFRASR
ncbi:MAG: hypothetical protein LBO78_01470, partial [Rickettsiales bacterium]|nr:hypothetical protein [Rickettsiales bacterium]